MTMIKQIEVACKNYPLYSQEGVKMEDKMVAIKLFDQFGSATWYITEYDPAEKLAFGYVEGLIPEPYCDEWGYINIEELASLKPSYFAIERIVVDKFFQPIRFGDIKIRST